MSNFQERIYLSERLKNSISKYSEVINKINLTAYKNGYLIMNNVLSRNTYTNNLLAKIYTKKRGRKQSIFSVRLMLNLFVYYCRSFLKFFLWLNQKLVFILSGYRSSNLESQKNDLIIIDTYFVVANLEKNDYRDKSYLRGLDTVFDINGKAYSYLPIFYGDNNPLKYISIFSAFKNNDVDYITEYELLNVVDIIKIILFIIVYPFSVLRLAHGLDESNNEINLVKEELLSTLNQVTWGSYVRKLVGRKLGRNINNGKLISWCEYQSIQKSLYKGIKESTSGIKIFGCQFFLKFADWVNVDIPDQEESFGLTPDVLLVNGKSSLYSSCKLSVKLGVSLRNKELFSISSGEMDEDSKLAPLLLLSYLKSESEKLLKFMLESEYKDKKIYIKAHPALNLNQLMPYIQESWVIVDGDLYDRLKDANIVITTASGTAAESVAIGKSVIIIASSDGITTNPLLNLGKGVIWDIVESSDDFKKVSDSLMEHRRTSKQFLKDLSKRYTELLFNDASDSEILAMFECSN